MTMRAIFAGHDDRIQSARAGLSAERLDALGDFETLADRLEAEVHSAQCAVASIAAVGARSRLQE